MSLWNLGGMNPTWKEFGEKHPDKTMIGMSWALQWRFMVLVLVLEIILGIIFFLVTVSN